MLKIDCKYYKKDIIVKKCNILNELLCRKGKCPFYKKQRRNLNAIR